MRSKFHIVVTASLLIAVAVGSQAGAAKNGLLAEMGMPQYPGAKLNTEIVLPGGPLLNELRDEFGQLLPISDMKEVSVASYSLDSDADIATVLKFFEAGAATQKWKPLVDTIDQQEGIAILINENVGMLVIIADPPSITNRQLTLVRATGTVDTAKLAAIGQVPPEFVSGVVNSLRPKAPVGQPVSIPPSEKLDIQSTKSSVTAHFLGQNTVQIAVSSGADNAGEMSRTEDGRLLLVLTPGLAVSDILLPQDVQILLEPTDGSLTISGSPGQNESPDGLDIVATGARVKIDSLPLTSGTHTFKVVGESVDASFSRVSGGSLSIEVKGGDITLSLPVNSSVHLDSSVVSGTIRNSLTSDQPKGDSLSFSMGTGKARISLKATNGNIEIKPAS